MLKLVHPSVISRHSIAKKVHRHFTSESVQKQRRSPLTIILTTMIIVIIATTMICEKLIFQTVSVGDRHLGAR